MTGRMLLLGASLLMPAAAQAQAPAPVRAPAAVVEDGAEDGRRLAALGLRPFRSEWEIIRHTFTAMEFAAGRMSGTRQIVVQLVPARDGASARLALVIGRMAVGGPMRVVSRREETLSGHEYRSLRTQLLRLGADLDMREQEVSNQIMVCSHAPWSRFDMKLGGESRLMLSRTGGCETEAAAYKAGDFLLVAAERILGAPIEGARPLR